MLRRSPSSERALNNKSSSEEDSLVQHPQTPEATVKDRKRRSTNHGDESLSIPSPTPASFDESHRDNTNAEDNEDDHDNKKQKNSTMWKAICQYMNSTRLMVLVVLCLQNSLFTLLRRYSQGVLQEVYSKHELLLVAEIIKMVYAAWMISKGLPEGKNLTQQINYLIGTSRKMFVLAFIYGAMNILSFVSLRNISAGMFTIFAQLKIISTATFSTIILEQQYSWTKWRALIALMLGVLLFSEPIWGDPNQQKVSSADANQVLGTVAVLVEVTLSGFASIYFEKVIKTDPLKLGIWERNFQLALGSFPVYIMFIVADGGGQAGFLGGWSFLALLLAALGAAGGLLVALSIKYGDSIMKTLATTGAIVLTGVLDHFVLGGPLTPSMMIAGLQVIIAICNYSFDATQSLTISRPGDTTSTKPASMPATQSTTSQASRTVTSNKILPSSPSSDEAIGLLRRASFDVENTLSVHDMGSPSKHDKAGL